MSQTPEEIAQLRKQLSQLDPAPFVELLADALQQRPTPEEWRRLAATAPDKFVKATKQMASVIGFSEKVAIDHSHKHHLVLENLNDMELQAFVRERRAALPLPTIETEAVEVKTGPASIGPSDADLRDAGIGATKSSTKTVPLAAADPSEEEQPK